VQSNAQVIAGTVQHGGASATDSPVGNTESPLAARPALNYRQRSISSVLLDLLLAHQQSNAVIATSAF